MSSNNYHLETDATPAAIVQPLRVSQPMPDPLVEPSPEQWDDLMSDEELNEEAPASEENTTLKTGTFKSTVHWKLSDDQINSLVKGYTRMVLNQYKFTAELYQAKKEYQQSLDATQKARRRYLQLFKAMKKNLVLIDKF